MNDMQAERTKKEEGMARWKRFFTILKFVLLLAIVIGIPAYLFLCHWDWIEKLRDLDYVREQISSYKKESALIYIGAQILQIIVSVLPGQPLQIAIGFIFGFFIAYLLSILGAGIGTVISYYLGRILGRDAVHMLFGDKRLGKYIDQMNSKRAVSIVFLIYLVPGLPKDIVSYAAGISAMKLSVFLLVSLVGRSPGMMASLLIGKQIYQGNYSGAFIIGGIALFAFLLALCFRKRLMAWMDRAYDKMYQNETKEEEA